MYNSSPSYSGWNNPTKGSNSPWYDPGSMSSGGGQNWGKLGAGMGGILAALGISQQGDMPNPADSAMPYLNQIPGAISPYFSPYIDAGKQAMGTLQNRYGADINESVGQRQNLQGEHNNLQNIYSQMTNNPQEIMNHIGQSFQQSPGFGFQKDQAIGAANRAAAAGGMLGTPAEQQGLAGTVNGMANQDYYNYLNHGMNLFGSGVSGMDSLYKTDYNNNTNMYNNALSGLQDINHLGFGASSQMGDNIMSSLMSQAGLAYSGQANQNQAQGQQSGAMWGDLGSAAASIIPFLATL